MEYKRDIKAMAELLILKTAKNPTYDGVREIIQNSFEWGKADEINITFEKNILRVSEKIGLGIQQSEVIEKLGKQFYYPESRGKTFGQFHYGRELLLPITSCIYFHIKTDKDKYVYYNTLHTNDFSGVACERNENGTTVICSVLDKKFNVDDLEAYLKEQFMFQLLNGKKISINDGYIQQPLNLSLRKCTKVSNRYKRISYTLMFWFNIETDITRGIRLLVNGFDVNTKIEPHIPVYGFLEVPFSRDVVLSKELQQTYKFRILREHILKVIRSEVQPFLKKEETLWEERTKKIFGQMVRDLLKAGEIKGDSDDVITPSIQVTKQKGKEHNYPETRKSPRPRGVSIEYRHIGKDDPIILGIVEQKSPPEKILAINLVYKVVQDAKKKNIQPKDFCKNLEAEVTRAIEDIIFYDKLTDDERRIRIEYATKCDQRRFKVKTGTKNTLKRFIN